MCPLRLGLGLALAAVALACDPPSVEDPAAVRAALMNADRQFAAATAAQRLDGWVGQFASDGKMVTRSGTIEGGPGIRAYMAPFFADTSATLAWEPRSAEAGAAADLGYTVGRYETTRRTRAGLAHETGTYVTLWRRADGRWRVALDIGTPDE